MSSRVFGDGLRRVLARVGLSQTDLAHALGVTRQTVNAWTTQDPNRRKAPSEDMRRRIAEALGVDEADIEKAARGRDLKPYERADSAAKTAAQNAERAFSRRLREKRPDLLKNVQRTIEYPGFGEQHYDYADNTLALVMTYRARKLDHVYRSLWELYKSKIIAERVGVERRSVLALIATEGADEYEAEAELAGIELVAFDEPEQLADWLMNQV